MRGGLSTIADWPSLASALQGVGTSVRQRLYSSGFIALDVGSEDSTSSPRGVGANYEAQEFGQLLAEVGDRLDAAASGRQLWTSEAQKLVENVRMVTEALVWGEKNDDGLFDLFCERQALAGFVAALMSPTTPHSVRVQLLQTISILIQNAHRDTSFYYLLSGGHLNTLLGSALDCEDDDVGEIYGALDLQDEEVLDYFVALVKGLALRLDGGSAQLFIDAAQREAEVQGFALLAQAARFTTHRDPMVRTGARVALLALLGIDHPKVRCRTVETARQLLVPGLARALRIAWAAAGAAVRLRDAATLRVALEAEEDTLSFINDLMLLGIPALAESLARGVLAAALLPLLAGLLPAVATAEPQQEALRTASVAAQLNSASTSGGSSGDDAWKSHASVGTPREDARTESHTVSTEIERAVTQHALGLEPAQRSVVAAMIERVLG